MNIVGITDRHEPAFEQTGDLDPDLLAHLAAMCGDLPLGDDARNLRAAALTTAHGYVFDTAGYWLSAQDGDIVITAKYGAFRGVLPREVLAGVMAQWAVHLDAIT
ncbi:hypothetical protein [Deinococcus ficus]|uniref:Uncharacterized protein n=1 Tax=Deinococcus ficus TaxID=317577 RepID=A0A221T3D6_9DEIO|nr:hypothetical protein [Deinococcus ficus]ASN83409.1 hypothetical protein DFI_19625 [Deinococcus ficus]